MFKDFEELHKNVELAIERCLYRSWKLPNSEEYLDSQDHGAINQEFQFLYVLRADSQNGFLTRGSKQDTYHPLVVGSGPDVTDNPTRISQIISNFLTISKPQIKSRRKTAKNKKVNINISSISHFPSPYSITQRILTDPSAIETVEIARFYSKLHLMKRFGVRVDLEDQEIKQSSNNKDLVTFQDLDGLYKTLLRYVSGRDPYSKPSDQKAQFLLCHTASNGFLTHRFPIGQIELEANKDPDESHYSNPKLYFEGDFEEFKDMFIHKSEFRKNPQYDILPTLAELSNRIFGIPIALSGFTDLLKGGLKQGAGEGTVSLIRGAAGTGKTTLAISIQRAVEALGIPTVFVTSEETIAAVQARRESVLSIAQKSHSQFKIDPDKHKILRAPTGSLQEPPEKNFQVEPTNNPLFAVLDGIIDGISDREDWPLGATDFTKLFVVFDGVHNFLRDHNSKDDYDILKRFVERCRDTGVQVLLTSSKDWMLDEGFEYLVDNYFTVESSIIEGPVPFADRKFQIVKTRHQGSMIGSHRMTIGDEGELQFQPNFSELLKKQARRNIPEPDNKTYSFPFRQIDKERYDVRDFNDLSNIRHYQNCSTLLYGVGSASKVDLSLRILGNPIIGVEGKRKKLLIVSFLSGSKYYEDCVSRHNRQLKDGGFANFAIDHEVLYFSPGMISPEEVYFQISSKIDNSEITLNAFDGVLLDGLHNVFVQFPRLMGKPELWTALTGLLRRCAVDFVITYSDFDISPAALLDSSAFSSERATPLMVALTQTLDYGYNIVPRYMAERERKKRSGHQGTLSFTSGSFEISCFIARHQQISADEFLIWNKEKKTLGGPKEL